MATIIPENQARFDLPTLLSCTGGVLVSGGCAAVQGVSTDTRRIKPGNLFVALVGEVHDAHQYVARAASCGAAALLVQRDVALPEELSHVAVIRVADTLRALGALAKAHRIAWAKGTRNGLSQPRKLVAVTGSAGKTTTCRAIAAVLNKLCNGRVHAPAGNLNNAVGVPMVLFGLTDEHDMAIVEVGTNAPGEVAYAASIAQPDVGVVTLIGCAHTEGLGSVEAVAREKGALFSSVSQHGVCVANYDDARVMQQVRDAGRGSIITFGKHERAQVRVEQVFQSDWNGQTLRVRVGASRELDLAVPLLGQAGVYASAAAVAVAWALFGDELDLCAIADGLREMKAEQGRLQPRQLACGAVVIDDAYNANPVSMTDSIQVVAAMAKASGRKLTLVLGEMRELGTLSEDQHKRVGDVARSAHPSRVIGVKGDARYIVERIAGAPSDDPAVVFVDSAEQALDRLVMCVRDRDLVLVKGSRAVQLEIVVRGLEELPSIGGPRG